MHERTQRAFARLVFVVCCALPTSLVLMTILVTWTPWYHHKCLREITASIAKDTGLHVTIEDFDRPSPTRLDLQNVRLFDPETNREVAKVYQVSWTTVNEGVSIVLQQPELQSSELENTWRLVHDRFLCQSICVSTPVRFAANDLTIHSSAGPMTLRDVDAWIEPGDPSVVGSSTRATIECLPSGQSHERGFRIEVVRDRSGVAPVTMWTLETGDTALPCSALAQYSDAIAMLGNDATFSGMMRWCIEPDGWWVDLSTSRFEQVDLARLFQRLPHQLTGKASLLFRRGMIRPGKTVDVIAELRAKDGMVGTSLLASMQRDLGMTIQTEITNARPVAYDHLAMQFQIFGAKMTLDGICRTEHGFEGLPAGVVFIADGYSMVQARELEMPAIALAKAVAPSHSVLVPISEQTTPLMQWLLPPSRALPNDPSHSPPPSPRIQTTQAFSGGPTISEP
ncbi:hypothetical protein Pla52o_03020 [Novipirellula galeiformis]|uniref:AsmA-like C-terminal domain-containing protein n=1 Tax=Novipirellula galeiformis TaxID=2528004 RepID=A0A5C6CUN6_9BACT|nr:hypothetical protein [Novipirellula galeiformis]TWU26449.1 hypothetical protein Pla52o_03020 [Novipirellula galeiformis]